MLRANPFLFSVTASWNNKEIIRPQCCQQIFISTYAKALFSAFAFTDFGAPVWFPPWVFGVNPNNNTQPGIPGPLLVLYVLQHSQYTAVTRRIRQSLKIISVACLIWYHFFDIPFTVHLVTLQNDFFFCFNTSTLPRTRRRLKAVGFTCVLQIGNLPPCLQDFVQMESKAAKITLHPLQQPGWQYAALWSKLLFS